MGLGWNWREAIPCNLLTGQRLSVDYTQFSLSISEKRPSRCDTGGPCRNASCAAVLEPCLCLVRARFRSVFWQLHASVRAGYASSYAERCELCVQQRCGWVLGYVRLSFERRQTLITYDMACSQHLSSQR